jgi:transposase-like protein
MDFPIVDLMDEDACYAELVARLHPDGLACPRCGAREGLHVHRRHRAPVLDYRCGHCRRVFNAFTGTAPHGIRRRPAELVLILRGIAQGVPTARLARELGRDRSQLLDLRHRWQEAAHAGRHRTPLDDPVLEADEMYQNAGEKRCAAPRPRRSAAAPRQQAPRARQLGQRPAAGLRRRGSPERRGPADGDAALGRGDAAAGGPAGDLADGAGLHRRVAGLRPPAGDRPVSLVGPPRGRGGGAG